LLLLTPTRLKETDMNDFLLWILGMVILAGAIYTGYRIGQRRG